MDDWRKKLSALKSIVIRFKVERREECSKELEANLEVFSVLKDLATQCAGWQPEILKKFVRSVSVQTHTHTAHYTQSCVCVGAAVSTALACVEILLSTIEHANSHSKTLNATFRPSRASSGIQCVSCMPAEARDGRNVACIEVFE